MWRDRERCFPLMRHLLRLPQRAGATERLSSSPGRPDSPSLRDETFPIKAVTAVSGALQSGLFAPRWTDSGQAYHQSHDWHVAQDRFNNAALALDSGWSGIKLISLGYKPNLRRLTA